MERKNYLTEELSKEEKAYLKRIIMTAKNKYFEKIAGSGPFPVSSACSCAMPVSIAA